MWILMAKYKNNEWEELDTIQPDSLPEQRDALLRVYKQELGQAYLLKWIQK